MAGDYRFEKWKEFHAPNPATLRYHLGNEGYSVFQWCDRPGMTYGVHKHEEDQCHWVVSGTLELSVLNVGVFILEAGDRDFMPAGTYHSARVLGEQPVLYLIGELRQTAKPRKTRKSSSKKTAKPKKTAVKSEKPPKAMGGKSKHGRKA